MNIEINNLIVYKKHIDARSPIYSNYPEELSEEIVKYLKSSGIEKLYCHQAQMYEKAENGENVVITTSTASGKTLSFLLPVLDCILRNPSARAIFIYPTKALASDQYRAMLPIVEYFGHNRVSAGVYDGDTPVNERSRIRQSANIILTNPEMINGAFLPNHSKYGFDFIFSNLKYVVIDELHTYRGAFGSHLANVFRRMDRVVRYYGSSVQYLCSSATIANPVELAEKICGRHFSLIDKDGSPSGKKNYVLIQPPKIIGQDKQYYAQVSAVSVVADMIPQLVEQGNHFITFAKSRRNVEVILKEARDKLTTELFFGKNMIDKISGYRGGYTPLQRKEIERKMVSGELLGLVSTNALELGIDIGKIDTTIITGYPGTRASFWQQTGRAGRSGLESTGYMVLENLPFDQYISINPQWLFDGESENAVIDENNLLIELAHIRAAAAELPLTLDDIALFPDLGETIPVLLRAEELNSQNGKFTWSGNAFPAGDYSLRNIDKVQYKLINKENNSEITQMDELQAFREIHYGAIYMHDSVQYQVVKLDLETKTSYAVPFNGNYYTMPGGNTDIRILHKMTDREYARINIGYGDVKVDDVIYMYKKLQFHTHQNLGYEQLKEPLLKTFETESVWLRIPENIVKLYRRLLQIDPNGKFVHNNYFEGLCYAIKIAAMMVTMTEREDIGVVMSNSAVSLAQTEDDEVYLFIYDKYIGGLGYSEKIYDYIEKIIAQAIELVSGCKCDKGCVACIGDYRLDKSVVLWGLKNLIEESEAPQGMKKVEYGKSTFIKKIYLYTELEEKWPDFCAFLTEKGEKMAAFLSSMRKIKIVDNFVVFQTDNEMYKNWIMQEDNKNAITNIIKYYTDAPVNVSIHIELKQAEGHKSEELDKTMKLQKRYNNLKDYK